MQRRLAALGHGCGADEPGSFGHGTEAAVRLFQGERGLRVDGICGHQTWNALVEAGFALGDRLLYHRTPPLRGDDVAELQRQLGALGFDAGRVDGIFGERTAQALLDFQRNAGLVNDGTCGPATIAALARLRARAGSDSVAGVREREALLQAPRSLDSRRVVIGDSGGLAALAAAVGRVLTELGARVAVVQEPDGSRQADQANAFAADVYVGLGLGGDGCATAFYATHGFESVGGRHLAELVQRLVAPVLGGEGVQRGMTLPVLRETRMPAVLCEVGPADRVVARTGELARALGQAVASWAEIPPE